MIKPSFIYSFIKFSFILRISPYNHFKVLLLIVTIFSIFPMKPVKDLYLIYILVWSPNPPKTLPPMKFHHASHLIKLLSLVKTPHCFIGVLFGYVGGLLIIIPIPLNTSIPSCIGFKFYLILMLINIHH